MIKQTKNFSFLAVLAILTLAACSPFSASITSTSANPPASAPAAVLNAPASQPQSVIYQTGNPPSDLLAAYQGTLEQIYAKVNPSVVNVEVVEQSTLGQGFSRRFGQGGQGVQTGLGSGFVWDTQGYIVTNNHVVDGASKVTVTFADGTTADAKVVGKDLNSDLAVIQVSVPASKLQPVTLADSTQVKVGQMAIAIGNPFGLSGTMTTGIVSGLNRTLPVGLDNLSTQQGGVYSIPDIIQTDASINPGNSGGVLVDDQGRLIGVTAAIASTTQASAGIGFVIPSSIVQKIVPALIKSGHADHSWMGVQMTTLTPDLVTANKLSEGQRGVLVIDVTSNSPAERAGLKGSDVQTGADGQQVPVGGDVIVAVDKHTVNRFEDLLSYLYENTQVGKTITLTVLRGGQQKDIQLTLGALPSTGNQ